MEIPFLPDTPDLASRAHQLRLQLTRVTLAQVLRQVTVTESCQSGRSRSYRLRLQLLPRSAYNQEFAVTPASVLRYVEDVWVRLLLKRLANTFKLKDVAAVMGKETAEGREEDPDRPDEDAAGELSSPGAAPEDAAAADRPAANDEDNSDVEAGADDDATAARSKARHNDEAEYESEEEVDAFEESHPGSPEEPGEDGEDREEDGTRTRQPTAKEAHLRRSAVCALSLESCRVTQYEFDEKNERWCQLTVVVSDCGEWPPG